ncbi:FecR domain-containing protein [Piscinibacter sp.]|uniref:FecR domain-containing protein n=1 Tax=Piscinibacter sp. TaxID=1903157 RepID=UPI0039E6592B
MNFPLRAARVCAAVLLLATASAARPQEPIVDYRVVPGDTLIELSKTVFAGPRAWREIARLNRLPDPDLILPGQVLRVPLRLMRMQRLPVTLASSVGEVRVGGAAAPAGGALAEGQQVETGAAGSAVLVLADGSRVRMPPSTLAEIVSSRAPGADEAQASRRAADGWFAGGMRLLRGSVEVLATKLRRSQPLEVETPTAVVGVRGTQYRVALDTDSAITTRSDVLEGKVRLESPRRTNGADIPAGFGATMDTSGRRPVPVELPGPPDLGALPERFERPLVRFTLPAETSALHLQVAQDEAFERIVADLHAQPGAEVSIAGLGDARWFLRARRVGDQGVEGYDAVRPFVLKARPEPPASSTPRAGSTQPAGPVEFQWSPHPDARTARLQVARDEAFQNIVTEREGLEGGQVTLNIGEPGTYHWRLASVRADGDQGPFGDAQRFELLPPTRDWRFLWILAPLLLGALLLVRRARRATSRGG